MVHGSWLKAHGSWPRKAGPALGARGRARPGPRTCLLDRTYWISLFLFQRDIELTQPLLVILEALVSCRCFLRRASHCNLQKANIGVTTTHNGIWILKSLHSHSHSPWIRPENLLLEFYHVKTGPENIFSGYSYVTAILLGKHLDWKLYNCAVRRCSYHLSGRYWSLTEVEEELLRRFAVISSASLFHFDDFSGFDGSRLTKLR